MQLEAKGDHLKAAHTKTVTKVRKTVDKLEQQLKDKRAENERLERRRRELEESVAMRQSILATRAAASYRVSTGQQRGQHRCARCQPIRPTSHAQRARV